MAKPVPQRLTDQPKPQKKWERVEVTVGPSQDVPMMSANKVVVNFIGDTFLITVLAAYPEPWLTPPTHPRKVEAKVLGRYAFSVNEWASAASSFTDQIERLQAEGAFSLEKINEETKQ